MKGLNLTVVNDDIVEVISDLYVKTPEALKRLLKELYKAGYRIESLRKADYRKRDGVSVQQMEKNGWSLWYASLPNLRYGKCNSCGKYIRTTGIQSHGHTCEKCGAVTYLNIIDGTTIRFEFISEKYRGVMFAPELQMKAKRWDTKEGYLYLYYEFLKGGLSTVDGKRAQDYLDENKGRWELVEEDGQTLLKIKYSLVWKRDDAVIESMETFGHQWNHKIVKLFGGKEYDEYGHLPVPENMSIYESWHWAPLPVTPTLHSRILSAAGQTDDQGWHYQDGRPWFTDGHWREMARFVRHFTQLDAGAFDRAWPRFRRDGPGGIMDIAHFCHEHPAIENRPNIGNALSMLGKAFSGQQLTQKEIDEGMRGAADDPNSPFNYHER